MPIISMRLFRYWTLMTEALPFKTTMDFAYGVPSPMGPGIARVVANNPGPFTFRGTNTYLVGSITLAVIDPGPDDDTHCKAILAAANGREITHILTTHAHRDHVDGVARLKAATGAVTAAFTRTAGHISLLAESPSGKIFVDDDYVPDISLRPGQVIEGRDWALEAIHTPGHAPDHASYALLGRRALFSGDHVMAWNTTVVAPPEGRMSDYIASLETLLERNDEVYLPGHGGRVLDPQRTVKAYLLHRRWREQAIVTALQDGARSVREIVPIVYKGLRPELGPAATLSVQAHVEFLVERGLVACGEKVTADCALSPA